MADWGRRYGLHFSRPCGLISHHSSFYSIASAGYDKRWANSLCPFTFPKLNAWIHFVAHIIGQSSWPVGKYWKEKVDALSRNQWNGAAGGFLSVLSFHTLSPDSIGNIFGRNTLGHCFPPFNAISRILSLLGLVGNLSPQRAVANRFRKLAFILCSLILVLSLYEILHAIMYSFPINSRDHKMPAHRKLS